MIKVYNLEKLRALRPPSMWRASPAHMSRMNYWHSNFMSLDPGKTYFGLGFLRKEVDYEKI